MVKHVRVLPIFYNRLAAACTVDQQLEIVARHLDPEGPVLAEFASNWEGCGHLPSRGPQWRYVALVLDDRACVSSLPVKARTMSRR